MAAQHPIQHPSLRARLARRRGNPQHAPTFMPCIPLHGRVSSAADAELAKCARIAQAGNAEIRNSLFLALIPRVLQMYRVYRFHDYWKQLANRSWTFDDLDQEAFFHFCSVLEQWKPEQGQFVGFCFGGMTWRARDTLRRWSAGPRVILAIDLLEPAMPDFAIAADDRITINRAFAAMSPSDVTVLRLRWLEGKGIAEIAMEQGVSTKTVQRRLTSALIHARGALSHGDAE